MPWKTTSVEVTQIKDERLAKDIDTIEQAVVEEKDYEKTLKLIEVAENNFDNNEIDKSVLCMLKVITYYKQGTPSWKCDFHNYGELSKGGALICISVMDKNIPAVKRYNIIPVQVLDTMLSQYGFDVNIDVPTPKLGIVDALFSACMLGNQENVKILLAHKANIHKRYAFIDNGTILHLAAGMMHKDISYQSIYQLLLEAGADENAKDDNNDTPVIIKQAVATSSGCLMYMLVTIAVLTFAVIL
ncbi:MAG: ankyrin repeat domain-containing protein [Selenomonadaceae bacterium]|nr:ankyrin repeat domain-containing protein [Selenomonadaceae bacterium]